ncbi:MAG: ABC transporter ATP-binding protein [Eubacteriales bacterium]|nr:ABC transporter ATP-binding protein [Eubacteriales bacterium]
MKKDRKHNPSTWSRLLSYALRTKLSMFIGLVLEFVGIGARIYMPIVLAQILDSESLQQGIADPSSFKNYLLMYFALVILASVCAYLAGLSLQYMGNKIANYIQLDVFSHLQKLPISYFDSLPAGKVVSRVTNDSKTIRDLFAGTMVKLVSVTFLIVTSYVMLFRIDFRLFLLGLISPGLVLLMIKSFTKRSQPIIRRSRRLLADINSILNESIAGIKLIQSLNREEKSYSEINETSEKYYRAGRELTFLYSYSSYTLTSAIGTLMLVLIISYFGVGKLTARWPVPIGSLYIFVQYMMNISDSLNQIMERMTALVNAKGAADHIFELLEEETIADVAGSTSQIHGEIVFKNVDFAYKDELVLKNFSFEAKAGSTVAFVGPTGSGKSTIMNLLFGFYEPGNGEILIDSKPLEDYDIQKLRRQMAIVLQDPYLFTDSIYGNISMHNEEISPEDAERALREVGGAPLLERLNTGIMSPVRERGAGFSTGERQLISFARALAQDPQILVLDEATANIDSETEALIQNGISKLKEGRTTLLIAHRLSTIKDCECIYVLDHGRIAESGSHNELLALNGLYAKMYREQSKSVA